ncbi:hypothetical protein C922_04958 [Plasmodium inui San Antonio 1]|uniref:Plasmodium RESA N-terminal domain-containing protein n=1 Tax=Plasmodium inui San Antonio 1 TaxID=1237626 RepID=W6ZV80_9APIC|nr:hypothetical protein C922_04958 [Plasmodium inui San Antonio 1]EUD64702.1 hypothetical protein C922_04958 [Plasmodium inui San Antonio 1]
MVPSDPFRNCAAEGRLPNLDSRVAKRVPGLTSPEVGLDESKGAPRRNGSTMGLVLRKLAVICALFFLLQNRPQLDRKDPSDLREKESYWRQLSQHKTDKREENVSVSKEGLDRLWKEEITKWKADMYELNKETFWEFKKVCLINNVNFNWENEFWAKFRNQVSRNIYTKEQKDYEDFSNLKSNKPTEKEIKDFIMSKRKSFDIFCDFLRNERSSLIDHVLKEWMKERSMVLDKMGHKKCKIQKLLKKIQKKKIAKYYS